jgi:hypothetical protein
MPFPWAEAAEAEDPVKVRAKALARVPVKALAAPSVQKDPAEDPKENKDTHIT